jgi:hypothetical protein
MGRPLARLVDFVAAEPVRLSAFLRLPLIGLIIVLVAVWEVEHWLPLAWTQHWKHRSRTRNSDLCIDCIDSIDSSKKPTIVIRYGAAARPQSPAATTRGDLG